MKKALSIISTVIMVLIIIASIGVVYKDVCFFEAIVVGDSMKTTLYEGDIGLVKYKDKAGTIKRGDIVVFEKGVYGDDEYEVVKRVIGIPGDHIRIDASTNNVYVNDELCNETYLNNSYIQYTSKGYPENFDMMLDKEDYYVMGDNRYVSYDSRYYGPVSINQIKGVLKVIYAHATFDTQTGKVKNKHSISWRFY